MMVDRRLIELIVEMVLIAESCGENDLLSVPIGVSNRHVHLDRQDTDKLFGKNYELHPYKELSQKGYFAAQETVVVAGPSGSIQPVRILGPLRANTQVELLLSDEKALGIKIPLAASGGRVPSSPVTIIGPAGTVTNSDSVMAALRHIHMNARDAAVLGLRDGDLVKVEAGSKRSITFSDVLIRTGEFMTEFHIDTDEANAAGVKNGQRAKIIL